MTDTDKVVVAATGELYVAAVGATQPTDPTSPFGGEWTELGYATTDGVTMTDSRTVEEITAWQSFYPVRRIVTGKDMRVAFSLLQWEEDTVKLAYGGGTVTEESSGIYKYVPPAPEVLDERAFAVDFHDGDKDYRVIFPKVQVVESVEVQLFRQGAAILPVTLGIIGEAGEDAWYFLTNDTDFPVTS